MLFKFVIFCYLVVLAYGDGGDCPPSTCAQPPKHYKELGCTPVKEDGECCASSYLCPDLNKLDKTKCHFNGKEYNVGDRIPQEDTAENCAAACFCDG